MVLLINVFVDFRNMKYILLYFLLGNYIFYNL